MTIPVYTFDVDIDTPSSFDPTKIFEQSVRASVFANGKLTPHPCGVYFQAVPVDPITRLAAAPHKIAEELGCFKMDFLHLSVYDHFTSREEITELVKHNPDWTLLEIPSVVKKLFQLGNHGELVREVRPKSVIELADCLALIRPQKAYLKRYYLNDRAKTRKMLYEKEIGSGYSFKKAHSLAYALVIVLQLHLIKEGIDI